MESFFLIESATIVLPYGGGSCSSNYVLKSNNQFYCITCYHSFLKIGLPFKYIGNQNTSINLKINGQKGGILEFGRLNKQLDFALIRLFDAPKALNTALPMSKFLAEYAPGSQALSESQCAKSTAILLPNAKYYIFETTLTINERILNPGDSGKLIAQNKGSKNAVLGWALGNTVEGSHLLPYHHINEFLNTTTI